MAIAAANAGALGSLGCALQAADQVVADASAARAGTNRTLNYNFFVHRSPVDDPAKTAAAKAVLKPWYDMFGFGEPAEPRETHRTFDQAMCDVLLDQRPMWSAFTLVCQTRNWCRKSRIKSARSLPLPPLLPKPSG